MEPVNQSNIKPIFLETAGGAKKKIAAGHLKNFFFLKLPTISEKPFQHSFKTNLRIWIYAPFSSSSDRPKTVTGRHADLQVCFPVKVIQYCLYDLFFFHSG